MIHDGLPVSIRIPNSMKFIWYDGSRNIKIKSSEYIFEAYFSTNHKSKQQQIALKHEGNKYVKMTKGGRYTSTSKDPEYIWILEPIEPHQNNKKSNKKQTQTKIHQFFQKQSLKMIIIIIPIRIIINL